MLLASYDPGSTDPLLSIALETSDCCGSELTEPVYGAILSV
jgi:hypothetical protein